MSLRKEVRPQISTEPHEKLSIMAERRQVQIAELAARLLEQAIAYEWHEESMVIARSERLGKRRRALDGD